MTGPMYYLISLRVDVPTLNPSPLRHEGKLQSNSKRLTISHKCLSTFLAFTTDEHLMSKPLFSPFRYPTVWNRWSVGPIALYHYTTFTSHISYPRPGLPQFFYVLRPNTISISNTIDIRGFFIHGSQKGLWLYPPPLFSVKIRLKWSRRPHQGILIIIIIILLLTRIRSCLFFSQSNVSRTICRFLLHNYSILYYYVLATGFQLPCIPPIRNAAVFLFD